MGKQTTDITIFHLDGTNYVKNVYHGCFWEEDQAAAIKKSGLSSVDSLYISIPYNTDTENLCICKAKDLAIQGEVLETIDNTSQATQSTSIKALKSSHDVFVISSSAKKCHGSRRMWHWELSGK